MRRLIDNTKSLCYMGYSSAEKINPTVCRKIYLFHRRPTADRLKSDSGKKYGTSWLKLRVYRARLPDHRVFGYSNMRISVFHSAVVERVSNVDPPYYRPVPQQEDREMHPALVTMMKECWNEQPNERPSFDEVQKMFRQINRGKWVISAEHWPSDQVWNCHGTVWPGVLASKVDLGSLANELRNFIHYSLSSSYRNLISAFLC